MSEVVIGVKFAFTHMVSTTRSFLKTSLIEVYNKKTKENCQTFLGIFQKN